jgi:hypothetical protein
MRKMFYVITVLQLMLCAVNLSMGNSVVAAVCAAVSGIAVGALWFGEMK